MKTGAGFLFVLIWISHQKLRFFQPHLGSRAVGGGKVFNKMAATQSWTNSDGCSRVKDAELHWENHLLIHTFTHRRFIYEVNLFSSQSSATRTKTTIFVLLALMPNTIYKHTHTHTHWDQMTKSKIKNTLIYIWMAQKNGCFCLHPLFVFVEILTPLIRQGFLDLSLKHFKTFRC